jgi:hypothetical protein
MEPDVVCDIRRLTSCFTKGKYDRIIFENVDYDVSFTKKAIDEALNLLKPGGVLISSTFPLLHPGSPSMTVEKTFASSKITLDMENGGYFFYSKGFLKVEGSPLLYWPNENCPTVIDTINEKLALATRKCWGESISNQIENIEFKKVSTGSLAWPSHDEASSKDVMIIQKNGDDAMFKEVISKSRISVFPSNIAT